MKHVQEQCTYSSQSQYATGGMAGNPMSAHTTYSHVRLCHKYVVGGGIPPGYNFSPKLKRIRTKGSKFENPLAPRRISKPVFKKNSSFPSSLTC